MNFKSGFLVTLNQVYDKIFNRKYIPTIYTLHKTVVRLSTHYADRFLATLVVFCLF